MEDNAQQRHSAALHPKKRISGKAGHKPSPSISAQNRTIEPSGDEAARQNRALYRLTRRIAQSGNEVDKIAQSAAELIADVIGDLCVISLLNSHTETIHIAAFHDSDPAARALLEEVVDATADFPRDQGVGARVLRSGQPLLLASIPPEQLEAVEIPIFTQYIKQVGIESVLVVPMTGRSGVMGTISLSRHRGGKAYAVPDQAFLLEIGYRVALAIENCLLVQSLRGEISARRSAKKAMLATEERFRSIFESTTLGIKVMDLVGTILETNRAFQNMLGYEEGELVGKHFEELLEPTDAVRAFKLFTDLKLRGSSDLPFEHRAVRKDGSIIWLRTKFAGVKKGGGDNTLAYFVGIVENITDQKQTELEMAELRRHLESNIELERLRLAQELHDGPMQELYGVSYRLEELHAQMDGLWSGKLKEMNDDIQQTLKRLRTIAADLRPASISDFGLEKAIRSYVEDFQHRYPNLNIQLSLAQDRQLLPENVRMTLFRVFQQSMMNIVRHAQASEVHVRFTLDAEEARLEVADNGKGFEVPPNWIKFARQGHYGLAGAAERISALGGLLIVESEPTNRTVVTAVVPWSGSST